ETLAALPVDVSDDACDGVSILLLVEYWPRLPLLDDGQDAKNERNYLPLPTPGGERCQDERYAQGDRNQENESDAGDPPDCRRDRKEPVHQSPEREASHRGGEQEETQPDEGEPADPGIRAAHPQA